METLTNAIAPIAAALLSLLTLWLTQRRTNALDARSAAKDTVELLAMQNEALLHQVDDLRLRLEHLEQMLVDCEHQRDILLHELVALRAKGE